MGGVACQAFPSSAPCLGDSLVHMLVLRLVESLCVKCTGNRKPSASARDCYDAQGPLSESQAIPGCILAPT